MKRIVYNFKIIDVVTQGVGLCKLIVGIIYIIVWTINRSDQYKFHATICNMTNLAYEMKILGRT